MNQKYYPLDFEAQYQETSQKMIEIAQHHREEILGSQPNTNIEIIMSDVQNINDIMEEQGLLFRKESIYSQFATGPQMKEKSKHPPELCPQCGQDLKKHTQCQFCAQLFCHKCCQRKRVIPFLSKDARLCCEQCHSKFVKLFENKDFYEEKEKLVNVINFIKNKTNRILQKVETKQQEVNQYRQIRRDEKIKEKKVESELIKEDKKFKHTQELWKKAITKKAERIKAKEAREQEEKKERKEREERERKEEERRRKAQEQKQREQKRLMEEEQERKKSQESTPIKSLSTTGGESVKTKEQQAPEPLSMQKKLSARQEQMMEAMRQKQEQLRRKEEELRQKQKQLQQKKAQSLRDSVSSTPKASNQTEKSVELNTSLNGVKSRRDSEEILPHLEEDSLKKNQSERHPNHNSEIKPAIESKTEEIEDPLERSLAKMFKPKKDEDSKSLYSAVSRTSKSVLDMSVNELLAVRIPQSGGQSAQPKPDRQSVERYSQPYSPALSSQKLPGDNGLGLPQLQEEEIRIHRDSVIRNSTLLSGNKDADEPAIETSAPEKCKCELM